jgi:hypothetical protein
MFVERDWFPKIEPGPHFTLSLGDIEKRTVIDSDLIDLILEDKDETWSNLVDILMGAGNLNYYSFVFHESMKGIFMKLVQVDEAKIKKLMFTRLLSFYWAFRKLGISKFFNPKSQTMRNSKNGSWNSTSRT